MTKLFRRKMLLLRILPGELSTTEDTTVVSGVEFTPLVCDTVNRRLNRTHLGAQEAIPIRKHSTIAFSAEHAVLNALYLNNRALMMARVLKVCGFNQTVINWGEPTQHYVYALTNGRSEAARVGFYLDGLLHVMTGCIGTCSLEMAVGQIPRWRFTLTGSYAEPVDAPMPLTAPTPTRLWTAVPVPPSHTATPTCTLHGVSDLPVTRFSLDVGNKVTWLERINADPQARITARSVTGSITIDAQAVADFDPIRRASNRTRGALEIVHQPAGGAQVTLHAPAVQLGAGITYQDGNGILQQRIPLTFLPMSGNDEFTMITR